MKPIQSERLTIRPVTPDDLPLLYRLLSDAETMQYIRTPDDSREAVRERLETWIAYAEKQEGLGVFVAENSLTNVPVGYCTARHIAFTPEEDIEIGYVLAPEHWGHGYATEITGALVRYLFSSFDLDFLVAFTDSRNEASQQVLLKNGFEMRGAREVYGGPCVEFWLPRP